MKYPFRRAHHLALHLVDLLRPFCERIEIAGSLRRMQPMVGDVEIVYVPRLATRPDPDDLFGRPLVGDLAERAIAGFLQCGLLTKRPKVNGQVTWGPVNKLAVHAASGIPVDLFATIEHCWFNYLVCRTGGAETNKTICQRAIAMGWHWEPYGTGFLSQDGAHVHTVHAERDVFDFVGMPFLAPELRS